MKQYRLQILTLFLAVSLFSCKEEDVVSDNTAGAQTFTRTDSLKLFVAQVMEEWYLWNDIIPELNVDDYDTPDDVLYAMMNKDLDKWSYIQEEEAYNAYFENAQYEGYGFRMAFDEDDNLRVAFVYNDSPFGRAGVKRSWIIDKIDGVRPKELNDKGLLSQALEGNTHKFEMLLPDGSRKIESLSKSTIGINTVLTDNVYSIGSHTIGYLAFNSFLATSEEELIQTFQKFKTANIDELIIDLRYNGGGRTNIAEWMASNIIGDLGKGKNFIEYQFNQLQSEQNRVEAFNEAEIPLNLDRAIFITSRSSASASELLINGLRPFVDVVLIGDNTYGKPVGSFPFFFSGYAISPISFKVLNDQGVGEYYQGLVADAYVADDLNYELGDTNEARLQEALYYIKNGIFSSASSRQQSLSKIPQIELEGFRREIGAF